MILPILIAMFACRINRHQAHVIRYLHEENRILKVKLKGKRIQLTDTERRRLAVLAHPIDRKDLQDLATVATPDTLQRWYRRLVVQAPCRKLTGKPLGRPRVAAEIEQLVFRMATENPCWGYRRIQGALSNLAYHIDKTTVRNILRRNHIDPAPIRGKAGMSWVQFLELHWEVLWMTGFFATSRSRAMRLWTIVTQFERHLNTWGVHLLGLIRHSAMSVLGWVAQQYCILRAGCLRHFDSQWHVALYGRGRVLDRVFAPLRLASSHRVTRQPMTGQVHPKQEPSAVKRPELVVIPLDHSRDEGTSGARFLSPSRADPKSHQLRSQYRYENSFPDSNRVAA